jgi:uncharacterized protein YdiU (UPF0061 family)
MSSPNIQFNNTYVELPERFYSHCQPAGFDKPRTIRVNEDLAGSLGFDPDWLTSTEGAEFTVGNRLLDGSAPIAQAYAGHQFGNFVGQLGDGRAILLGETIDDSGQRYDIQLKGGGQTPYSRRGDGRCPLGPALREYLVSEAMHALGIRTTRSLAVTSTGEQVRRQGPEPGAVLVRVARSHIRVGTFEYFAARDDTDALETLLQYSIDRHYPDLESDSPVALFEAVARRQAELIAHWQLVGFIHGVMNTDNMLICGDTIDYGPCAFMNEYDPSTVFSSIDRRGRYAFANQPKIAKWNLERFADTLMQIADDNHETRFQDILDSFPDWLEEASRDGMADKLGLDEFQDEDGNRLNRLLELMREHQVDYTLTFRRLSELADPSPDSSNEKVGEFFSLPEAFSEWLSDWRRRLRDRDESLGEIADAMKQVNPAVIPRNYQVNDAIQQAVEDRNFGPFHDLVDALGTPFEYPDKKVSLLKPPEPDQRVTKTFCGT